MTRIFSAFRIPARRTFWIVAVLATSWALPTLAEPIPDTCEIHYPSDTGIPWTCHRITRHDTLTGLFGAHWQDVLRFNRIDRRHIYPGVRIKVPVDLRQVNDFTPMPTTYLPAATYPQFILVNLTQQFLGAYDFGKLIMSFPISSGQNADPAHRTPDGFFRVSAYDELHQSSLYDLETTDKPYPMHYALRFYISRNGVSSWIHGRDMPGYAASHGCIGLYDEQMQKEYYGDPRHPVLEAARTLYDWATAADKDKERSYHVADGITIQIVGEAPDFPPEVARGTLPVPPHPSQTSRTDTASAP